MIDTLKIKEYLRRGNMTQAELAEQIGINPATLNRKINNVDGNILSVKEANQIVAILNVPKEELTDIFFD